MVRVNTNNKQPTTLILDSDRQINKERKGCKERNTARNNTVPSSPDRNL